MLQRDLRALHGGAGEPAAAWNPSSRTQRRPPGTFRRLTTCRGSSTTKSGADDSRQAKTTGFGLVNTQRRSKDRQVAKRRAHPADAAASTGHIPTVANVSRVLDHQIRRTTTLREAKTTGFGFVNTQRRSKDQQVAKENPSCGRSGDHRAHSEGCQRVGRPRPPNSRKRPSASPNDGFWPREDAAQVERPTGRERRTHPADAAATTGHIPRVANVSGVLDHQIRRRRPSASQNDRFWPREYAAQVERPTGREEPNRPADAAATTGHIPTVANVSGVLDHQIRRNDPRQAKTTGFGLVKAAQVERQRRSPFRLAERPRQRPTRRARPPAAAAHARRQRGSSRYRSSPRALTRA